MCNYVQDQAFSNTDSLRKTVKKGEKYFSTPLYVGLVPLVTGESRPAAAPLHVFVTPLITVIPAKPR